jgi:hypothetical protein
MKTATEIWQESNGSWWVRVYDISYPFETREEAEDFYAAHA